MKVSVSESDIEKIKIVAQDPFFSGRFAVDCCSPLTLNRVNEYLGRRLQSPQAQVVPGAGALPPPRFIRD